MDKKLFLAIGRKLEERNVKELIRLRKRAVRYLKKSNKKSVKTDWKTKKKTVSKTKNDGKCLLFGEETLSNYLFRKL